MNPILHRFALCLFAACLTWPAAAENAPSGGKAAGADAAKARDYVRYVGDDKRGRLETVVVTMKKDGVTVELIGAVHVADAEYYKTLTKLFAGYEELLFELVDGQRLKADFEGAAKGPASRPDAADAGEKSVAIKLIGSMMRGVGSYFRFQYQTEGIDYHTKNFVHADVSMDEFVRLQGDRGETFTDLIWKAMAAQADIGPHRETEPKGSQLLLALLGDSSGLKVAMARQLGVADELVAAMEHGGESVIISDRNKKALEVFDREVAAGRANLGIFYGAAHLGDMEDRLVKKGFQRTGERWLTAWDIKPRVDELSKPAAPAE